MSSSQYDPNWGLRSASSAVPYDPNWGLPRTKRALSPSHTQGASKLVARPAVAAAWGKPAVAGTPSSAVPLIRAQKQAAAMEQARLPAGAPGDSEYIDDLPSEPVAAFSSSPKPQMRGRLRAKVNFWRTFVRSTLVLSWITHGFPLVFNDASGPPPPIWLANHASASASADFVSTAINDLVDTGAAVPCQSQPRCVLPLGVVTRAGTGKQRLVWDGRWVNHHLQTPSFKYETLEQLGTLSPTTTCSPATSAQAITT
jgi:hypothetical protein